jgi:hypothetical protein
MRASTRWIVGLALVVAGSPGAGAQNLHPNGDFNDVDGTAGWTENRGTAQHQTDDPRDCPVSGSLRGVGDSNPPLPSMLDLEGPCVAWGDDAGTAHLSFEYQGSGGSLPGSVSYFFHSFTDAACQQPTGETVGFETFEVFPWVPYEGTLAVPAGGSLRLRLTGACDGACLADVDEIRVTRQPHAFLDDFEGGGTCRWSSATP